MTTATPIEQTDRIEELRTAVEEAGNRLGDLRTEHVHLEAERHAIGEAVKEGDASGANEVAELIRQQGKLADAIRSQERERAELQAELQHAETAAKRAATEALFARMRARRQRISELCREASLELGLLQGEDRKAGEGLVPRVMGSATQMEFVSLLEPITAFKDPAWAGRHVVVPCGYEYCIQIPAMRKL